MIQNTLETEHCGDKITTKIGVRSVLVFIAAVSLKTKHTLWLTERRTSIGISTIYDILSSIFQIRWAWKIRRLKLRQSLDNLWQNSPVYERGRDRETLNTSKSTQ